MNFRSRWTLFIAALAVAFTFNHVSNAEAKRVLITQKIQESNLVALTGNTRPDANKKNDRGAVADDLPLDHLMLQLRRPNELETALEQYIGQLHDPKSQNFHKWLTAAQVGATYGLAHLFTVDGGTWAAHARVAVSFTLKKRLDRRSTVSEGARQVRPLQPLTTGG